MGKKAINYIIFFEFLKQFIITVMNKNKFESLVENIYEFYSDLLNEYEK
jgi:heme oxygenase